MIKKYKQFNEGIKHLIVGPTKDEVIDNLKQLPPNEMLIKSCNIGFLDGVKIALERGAKISYDNFFPLRQSHWLDHIEVEGYLREQYPPTSEDFFKSLLVNLSKNIYGEVSQKILYYKNISTPDNPFQIQQIFKQNIETQDFLVENKEIWEAFLKVYYLNNNDIKKLIKEYTKEYLNLNLDDYKISYF